MLSPAVSYFFWFAVDFPSDIFQVESHPSFDKIVQQHNPELSSDRLKSKDWHVFSRQWLFSQCLQIKLIGRSNIQFVLPT